jgi:hypothetical protein
MRTVVRALTAIMGVLFLFAVAVQYNDPDPAKWIAIYAAAALACALALLGRLPRWLPVLIGGIALLWAATLAPGFIGRVRPGELFEEFEMKSPVVEEAREAVGLVIVAAWMIVLFMQARRTRDRIRLP